MLNASPRPWRIKESALTAQLMIVDADGFTVAFVNATSKRKKMPTTDNAMLIIETVNSLSAHRDQIEQTGDDQ